jgi:hypothetical protein
VSSKRSHIPSTADLPLLDFIHTHIQLLIVNSLNNKRKGDAADNVRSWISGIIKIRRNTWFIRTLS